MLQQTTVAAVKDYFHAFTTRWPDVHALASAPDEDVMAAWAGLGYYARARNLLKCARTVSNALDGVFPDTEEGLRELPGIGPYTAAAIAAIAFGRPAAVMDGNVERVMARIHAIQVPLPDAKPTLKDHVVELTPTERPGDYAQAVMDLGATICTPKRPACGICPWRPACQGHRLGIADTLPRKAPKKAKPVRLGYAWVALDGESRVLTVTRPEKGLLGGMLAVPSSDWGDAPNPSPPFAADLTEIGEVTHTFTHFHLRLRVNLAEVTAQKENFRDASSAMDAMPTVFAKVLRLALAGH
jgi:A/G-specific adenine glycosylase